MNFGILGSGSWGTALAKILTDNGQTICWWNRSEKAIDQLKLRRHNAHYLNTAYFDISQLKLSSNASEVITNSDCIIIAIPSAYIQSSLNELDKSIFKGKKILSAVKGIMPGDTILLNDYFKDKFRTELQNYFTVLGPCHAEEVAAEKLSYLTFSGIDEITTQHIARYFETDYLNTIVNNDIYGVQYAAILKNIYAVGAGIAHGLDYGDNFLSVLIANCANEMVSFLQSITKENEVSSNPDNNYAASVYLGDLLVTCYSLFSRNRTFGNMIGKGYSVQSAQIEMSMVAEGFNASKGIYEVNKKINAVMPIAETIYAILWQGVSAAEGFKKIEPLLV